MQDEKVPLAVARALRQAAAHPSVRDVAITGRSKGATYAKITIRSELPASWRFAGQSPFGVRVDEVVFFGFNDDFPLIAPGIALRDDFPRFHPHIQPDKPGSLVRPCLVMGSPREVIQARGFLGLVEQLVIWLERAASLDLNDPSQGWEPVRRDSIDDLVACDGDAIRARVTPNGGVEYWFNSYVHYEKGDTFKILLGSKPIDPANSISLIKRDEDEDPGGAGLAITAWPGSTHGVPIVTSLYLPETVETVGELLARAELYGCKDELLSGLATLRALHVAAQAAPRFPLLIILLARRPYPLVGSLSNIEICPYLIDVNVGQDFLDLATPVRLVAQRETINVGLLRRTSRDNPDLATRPWTLIGCGSVGSKIALHSARNGRAPSVLVDRGYLDAHNYARHSALPYGQADRLFLRSKAGAVQEQLTKLGQPDATVLRDDAVGLVMDPEKRVQMAPHGTAMIVDTTASLITREALSHTTWEDRPRAVEACLMGAGRLAYLAREGAHCNPTLSDLAVEAYRKLSADPELATVAFGAEAEEIVIGQGCSAATFPMPDSELSLLSAAMARTISTWTRNGLPGPGELRIGRSDENGGLSWSICEEAPWVIVEPSNSETPGVRLHPRVHAAIEEDIAQYPGLETGGVLVGRFSVIGNLFQIVDLIPAPPDSTRSAEEFRLGTQGLKAAAHKVASDTGGALQVVGTWHNHLTPSGPSGTDMIAGGILALRQLVPALLLIHTPKGYSMLVAEALMGQDKVGTEGETEEPV